MALLAGVEAVRIKRSPADIAFSLCVRERTGWTCESCHKSFPRNAANLHASHLFSRRHNSTRWSPENCFAHCFSCHQKLGGDPVTFTQWAEARMGPKKIQELHQKAHLTLKLSKVDKAFIAEHYRQQHREMIQKRQAGNTAYLQFEHWG